MKKIIIKLLKKILGITNKVSKKEAILMPSNRMYFIEKWENPTNEYVIRSSFNRELYHKYLKAIKNV